nr:MFS transporter [Bacillus subtilis]
MHMSNGAAGFLTALPLLSFAVLSPLAPKLGQRLGNERTLWLGLVILLIGVLTRSTGYTAALFFGTALIGVGIAIGNVLLPSLIKHKYPEKPGIMISLYTTSMNIFAALASGVSVPLATQMDGGWKQVLSLMGRAGFTCIANLDTSAAPPGYGKPDNEAAIQFHLGFQNGMVCHHLYGLQSFLFYSSIAWFPEILRSHGIDTATAGWMVSLMQFASLPSTFLTPVLADRVKQQRGIVAALVLSLSDRTFADY